MSLEKNFCPSPWFHIRINNLGTYEYCRWQTQSDKIRHNLQQNIAHLTPLHYFQHTMAPIRQQLLAGESPRGCSDCQLMEQHGKVSGRQRQLLKAGIQQKYFAKSLASSPLRSAFDHSFANQGSTTRTVTDWQIDLGNYCNSACVFCKPEFSSRLATEFKQLGLIDLVPPASWCDDAELLQTFIDDLVASPDLVYLHFIGGETTITPAFKTILVALIKAELHKKVNLGFTTNLTVWPQDVIDLLMQFDCIHLGLSLETLTPINDYARWPSQQQQTRELLDRWVSLARTHDWLVQLRITPSCLTIHELHTVYDYAWQHALTVESCNFIEEPRYFRINVLPVEQRQQALANLETWVKNHCIEPTAQIINTRDPNIARVQMRQDAESYISYLKSEPDESFRLPDLVEYLKLLEQRRGNSILDYLPQYENIFRSAGY